MGSFDLKLLYFLIKPVFTANLALFYSKFRFYHHLLSQLTNKISPPRLPHDSTNEIPGECGGGPKWSTTTFRCRSNLSGLYAKAIKVRFLFSFMEKMLCKSVFNEIIWSILFSFTLFNSSLQNLTTIFFKASTSVPKNKDDHCLGLYSLWGKDDLCLCLSLLYDKYCHDLQ